jgi:hypothetical protein
LPVPVVTVSNLSAALVFLALTVAPGTMALTGSDTVPVIVPRSP